MNKLAKSVASLAVAGVLLHSGIARAEEWTETVEQPAIESLQETPTEVLNTVEQYQIVQSAGTQTDAIYHLIWQASQIYGLDADRLVRIAVCESRLNPLAMSPGGHKGIFQFADTTWRWASSMAGFQGWSPFNPTANIYSAAWLMSQPGGYKHWECI